MSKGVKEQKDYLNCNVCSNRREIVYEGKIITCPVCEEHVAVLKRDALKVESKRCLREGVK